MPLATSSEAGNSIRFLESLFRDRTLQHVSFRFWDGSTWPERRQSDATFVLKHPGSVRQMFGAGTEKGLAEAFLRDDFDVEGDLESAFELADALRQNGRDGWLRSLRTLQHFHRLPKRTAEDDKRTAEDESTLGFQGDRPPQHSLERDRAAVSFHYDVSNDFFKLWLDRQMVYSCAYFGHRDVDLDSAQEAKMTLLCRKLRLQPGQRLLDIGCGWGALAMFAATHFGVHVTGVTLSQRQAEYASERIRAAGLEGKVSIALLDYRELRISDRFDAIVSVGMAEHVGTPRLADYFKTAAGLLRPGGVFLNHAIGESVRATARLGPSFIHEYVFPDSEVPPIHVVLQAAESAGLEVRDVENLREHYALTLRHWVRRLEAAHADARRLVSESTYRIWRLYMAGSAHAFTYGELAVYQTLLSNADAEGRSHTSTTIPYTKPGKWCVAA